jgi:hypothetical protein
MQCRQRSNERKMGPFGVKPLTLQAPACLNSGSLSGTLSEVARRPLSAEGKEFLLTPGGQSVMNIFTASGFRVHFFVRSL